MSALPVVVLGGSVAGLMTALALARTGTQVELVERDALTAQPSEPAIADNTIEHWWRKGAPQARHTHALAALGRRTLQARAADVWQALIDAGAIEMPFGAQLEGAMALPRCADPELFGLSVRRSLVEDVLKPLVLAEPMIRVQDQTSVSGLLIRATDIPVVEGVTTTQGDLRAALTIDALGRGSSFAKWLRAAGVQPPEDTVEGCGLAYFTRWYRILQRPSVRLDAGFSAGGYAPSSGCIVCPADNGYASITMMVPYADKALHAFTEPAAFTAAARLHAGIAPWLQPGVMEALSGVLRWPLCENRYRTALVEGRPRVLGAIAVGDALCITNPTYTRGMSLAIRYAFAIADLLQRDGLNDAYRFAVNADALAQDLVRPWHDDSVAQDRVRTALWAGGPAPATPPGAITLQQIAMAARHDEVVWQPLARRSGMLDAPEAIFHQADVLARVRSTLAQMRPSPPAGPSRADLLRVLEQHRNVDVAHPLA
ncbi:NAD(P)/FAD-dependent oxidoreductase [Xanthomonas hortorum]|uniref:FAD-dependent monooxygenase n=1 Tax=Xanthomonas hortorum pv. pelargonii TaxID=453602 RepID=A0A6V7E368_9XANT|nr:FAD-dependent monooxygenase [Xanthomonas hortorum]MCE4354162.1 FAD-dependent monooxygenase [Xanthomonas hortorum pv. pelargonii]MCM5523641.1 FAD-dependent monooxygenase [Xanthomonas hortorum pv. pelargonii]MCM5534821.1 FAD-dependent monooxygenase [Xanthomonas hortorum pv. pelargonii]MCM5540994.1 FAD-dependent monooxygenase [Xanthomonas hortorum pv. pelargonii]MCM5544309.1 FAD-dependent monooxygenase [Xanthomonas hortorum pv. pelargonii]